MQKKNGFFKREDIRGEKTNKGRQKGGLKNFEGAGFLIEKVVSEQKNRAPLKNIDQRQNKAEESQARREKMLRSIKEMLECSLTAKDGDFGRIDDVFLDDKNWSVRYLVVDTGTWLPDRKFLIPFPGTSKLDWSELIFPLSLTRQEVLNKYVRGVIGKYVRFGK